jgi:metal-responsive CopG/Arc/MetJ family transcriptional regulator
MKPIQVVVDEKLLRELDATEEVKREGRSAVLRRVLADYLRRGRQARIKAAYERAYGESVDLGVELEGWEEQGTWLDE